jgi:hypothetical protein
MDYITWGKGLADTFSFFGEPDNLGSAPSGQMLGLFNKALVDKRAFYLVILPAGYPETVVPCNLRCVCLTTPLYPAGTVERYGSAAARRDVRTAVCYAVLLE